MVGSMIAAGFRAFRPSREMSNGDVKVATAAAPTGLAPAPGGPAVVPATAATDRKSAAACVFT